MLLAQTEAVRAAEAWLFYPAAALAVAGALGVVFTQQIVRTAIALLFTLGAVALLYFLLAAEFLAAIQLVVYVGGTLILIIFGVMLTSKNPFVTLAVATRERVVGWSLGALAALLMIFLGLVASQAAPRLQEGPTGNAVETYGIHDLGVSLLTRYAFPLEVAGVLLLVVMIGAAYIAKGRSHDAHRAARGAVAEGARS